AHLDRLAGGDELPTRPERAGVGDGAASGDPSRDAVRTGYRVLRGDRDRGGAPATEPDERDRAGLGERTDASEQRCRGAGITELGVHRAGGDVADAQLAGHRRAEAAVGVGERPRADRVRVELLTELVQGRDEDLLAEEARVVEVARRRLAVTAV